ncbi:hypothetical protein [Nostoc sp.]|uniref:hypothetical protein n=1 Tax=Nostoc sp. TaxID=1180 RepID=UPI002FF350E7
MKCQKLGQTLLNYNSGIKVCEMANRNNIFCHCRSCSYEWVDSVMDAVCGKCSSKDIEHISCWQFPDD